MNTALVRGRAARSHLPASPLVLAGGRQHTADTILRAWFESKSPHTIAAYRSDLEEFALFVSRALALSTMTVSEVLRWFFRQGAASAQEIALHFRAHLDKAGMAPSSINRHLAALRSLTALGRMLGAIAWQIEVPGLRGTERRRDTRGPDPATVRAVLEAIDVHTSRGARDAAVIHTLYGVALRAAELCRLDRGDLDATLGTLWVLGKGRREKELLQLPAVAVAALSRYLQFRGTAAGPLFKSDGNRGKQRDQRLETRSVLRIVRTRGAAVGVKLWTHGLRHAAITVAIEQGQRAGVGLDQIRHFSRHKQVATMMLYRDEREQSQTQARLAEIVGATVQAKGGA